jgi:hypothetical protein
MPVIPQESYVGPICVGPYSPYLGMPHHAAPERKKAGDVIVSLFSPKEFAAAFRDEAAQTVAYLLSFVAKKSYVKKALKLIGDENVARVTWEYLKSDPTANPQVVYDVLRIVKFLKRNVSALR